MTARENEQGFIVFLRCAARDSEPKIVAWRPEVWPPPAQLLLSVDDDSIPPMDKALYDQVKRDERTSFSGPHDSDAIKRLMPGIAGHLGDEYRPTKCVPRRRFVRTRQWGMTLWAEGRVLWVDVPR